MAIGTRIRQYAGRRLARRLSRSIPWIGGSADTALDMIPFVGGAKNLAEVIRGRDFIRDKQIAG